MLSRVIYCNSCFLRAPVPALVSSPTPVLNKVPKNSYFCSLFNFIFDCFAEPVDQNTNILWWFYDDFYAIHDFI